MKELNFIEIIKKTLGKNSYIGDDCAYLKDLGIVVTQDSLVENVHFSTKFSTPYMLAYKSIMVNLSDIFAAGAIPKYFTISLSVSNEIDENFVKAFYKSIDGLSHKFNFEVIGGDITGSDKIYISICAIGVTEGRNISSRKNAKQNDIIVTTGVHGSSAAGLWLLQNNVNEYPEIKNKHLMPIAQRILSDEISTKVKSKYAMMDTSDGLVDALFKIARSSDVLLEVDFKKIPYDKDIEKIAKTANKDFKDWIFYGGEDYQIIACLDEKELKKIDKKNYTIIGKVKEKSDNNFVEIKMNDEMLKISDLEKTFNHFKENK